MFAAGLIAVPTYMLTIIFFTVLIIVAVLVVLYAMAVVQSSKSERERKLENKVERLSKETKKHRHSAA